ncbi:6-carboxytetrahydropterin synthase [Streptomyces sp. NPDC020379]|uniref:6-carboxytetrahydropterin synthase n=1 Tax=Streptomyces sp. NPDC020379 TaxID=3365071 RepID=UPI0037A65D4A
MCARPAHGHNYAVEPTPSADDDGLEKVGFIRDCGELTNFRKWLDNDVDHRHPGLPQDPLGEPPLCGPCTPEAATK